MRERKSLQRMKNILITGADSYIGTALEGWLARQPYQDNYHVETLDMQQPEWKLKDFSKFDVVFHVAGIAHSDVRNVSEEVKSLYYQVNTALAVDTAEKAMESGVRQFIFMSSIIVYGESSRVGKKLVITRDMEPKPANFYGDSKLQADIRLEKLNHNEFHVVILRPPMIYGKGSRGNYPKLAALARKIPFFPDIRNERSMLHIDNLCEFIRLMIENDEAGIFYPQNREYVCTAELVREIGRVHGKRIMLLKLLNPFVYLMGRWIGMVNKVFGSLVYEKGMSDYQEFSYCINDFKESVKKTEGNLN